MSARKIAAGVIAICLLAAVIVWHSRIRADFLPLDRSSVGPNILAELVQVSVLFIAAALLWPPWRRRAHAFLDRKLERLHGKLDDLHKRHDRAELRHDRLAGALTKLGRSVGELHERHDHLDDRLDHLATPAVRRRIRIPERPVAGRRLGRHIVIDARSARHPAELAPKLQTVTHRAVALPLDQGQIGSCTANALIGALNTFPHWKPGQPALAEPDAVALYHAETILEGDPYPPNDPGGSGLEVCQAARNAGMLSAYQHADGIDQALAALVPRPVITGINWFTSFDTPDVNGRVTITPRASVRGGHEILAVGLDVDAELVWLVNSWGTGYGVAHGGLPGGCFCMSFQTWATLIEQGGDVTVPRTALGWVAQPLAAT